MILSPLIAGVLKREFGEPQYAALGESLAGLDESVFDHQDPDRMVGAILILVQNGLPIATAVGEATTDWRDLLMGAGLENDDWATVLADRFGTHPSS